MVAPSTALSGTGRNWVCWSGSGPSWSRSVTNWAGWSENGSPPAAPWARPVSAYRGGKTGYQRGETLSGPAVGGERTLAWLSKCGAILARYHKKASNYVALIQQVSALLWYRRQHRLMV